MEMMQKLINQFSKKHKEIYEIVSKWDKHGILVVKFDEEQIFKNDCDYIVSLIKFETSAFFPNIKDDVYQDSNNIFNYSHVII